MPDSPVVTSDPIPCSPQIGNRSPTTEEMENPLENLFQSTYLVHVTSTSYSGPTVADPDSFPATTTADILLASNSQVTLTSVTLTSDPCFMKTTEIGHVHLSAVLEGPAHAKPSSLIGSHSKSDKEFK